MVSAVISGVDTVAVRRLVDEVHDDDGRARLSTMPVLLAPRRAADRAPGAGTYGPSTSAVRR